jgi:hypothetical protein
MKAFFYKYWWLYYLLFFFLLGLLIYALLWRPSFSYYSTEIINLKNQLEDCRNRTIDEVPSEVKDSIIDCDAEVKSGGEGTTETEHELGAKSGKVVIEYDMVDLPDEIKVIYDNKIVAQSNGLVSSTGSIEWQYTARNDKPTVCTVIISAPQAGTEWHYKLNCPE